jgi:hypothetical protein
VICDYKIPDNAREQAVNLVFFLGLPSSRERYGLDTVAAIQARLSVLIYSISPEESLPQLWAECLSVRAMLAGQVQS